MEVSDVKFSVKLRNLRWLIQDFGESFHLEKKPKVAYASRPMEFWLSFDFLQLFVERLLIKVHTIISKEGVAGSFNFGDP